MKCRVCVGWGAYVFINKAEEFEFYIFHHNGMLPGQSQLFVVHCYGFSWKFACVNNSQIVGASVLLPFSIFRVSNVISDAKWQKVCDDDLVFSAPFTDPVRTVITMGVWTERKVFSRVAAKFDYLIFKPAQFLFRVLIVVI